MEKAISHAKEILRMQAAIAKTNSEHLKADYKKSIKRKTRELEYYCQMKGVDTCEVWRAAREETATQSRTN